jgi:hypothetical protein
MTRVDLFSILVNTNQDHPSPCGDWISIARNQREKLKTQYKDWNHGDSNLIITSWLSRFIYLSRDWSLVIIWVETKVHPFNMSTLFKKKFQIVKMEIEI